MTKDQILNEINSNVYYCVNAHNAVYRGKVFAVKNGDIKFFKTRELALQRKRYAMLIDMKIRYERTTVG